MYNEIRLCAQNIYIVLGLLVDKTGRVQVIIWWDFFKIFFNLTSYKFCTSTPKLELMTISMICNGSPDEAIPSPI